MTALGPDLLRGQVIVGAGPVRFEVAEAVRGLGASLLELDLTGEEAEHRLEERVASRAPVNALLYDAAGPFGGGGDAGLRDAIDRGWAATRAVAAAALIPQSGGKIVLLAPQILSGPFASAACAGLENMARTLSVEWARHNVTTTAIAPGEATTDREVAELVGFLLSPAGDYFSGCLLSLGAVG